MWNLFAFLIANSLVFAGAGLTARYGFRIVDRLALALATTIFGWISIVVGMELLGQFGLIRLVPALLWAVGLFAGGLVAWRLGSMQSGSGLGESAARTGTPLPAVTSPLLRWSLLGAAALTLWAGLDVLIASLCGPVLPISDAPIYHLYFPLRWWHAGTLDVVPTPFGESAAPYFPANANVWFTWLLVTASDELAAKVGQWPFLWVTMAAVVGLARECRVRWEAAGLAAILWGTGTLPVLNSGFADVDLVLAAWLVTSAWFLVRYARGRSWADLAVSAMAMGAALGTKTVAILFVPPLWLIAAAAILRGTSRRRHGTLLIAATAVPCIYWYARNLLLTGNPIYPLHLDLFGWNVLDGWYRRETLKISEYHIPVENGIAFGLILLRGFDPILVPFWLGGLGAAIWAACRGQWLPLVLVFIAAVHGFLFWFVNPYQTQDRFLFAAFALLAVPSSLLFNRWPWLGVPFVVMLFGHLVLGPVVLVDWVGGLAGVQISQRFWPPLMPAPLNIFAESGPAWANAVIRARMVLCAAIAASAFAAHAARNQYSRCIWTPISLLLLSIGLAYRIHASWIPLQYERLRFIPVAPQIGYTPGWLVLEELSRNPVRVAYAGTNLPYYLFGSRLRNSVEYVNINRHATYRMHEYHEYYKEGGELVSTSPTPDWDRREADESAWLSNLRDRRIDLLFIGFVNRVGGMHNVYDSEGFPIERSWADRHPEIFTPVHTTNRTRLYSVQFTD